MKFPGPGSTGWGEVIELLSKIPSMVIGGEGADAYEEHQNDSAC
jgi:hypothetical protein